MWNYPHVCLLYKVCTFVKTVQIWNVIGLQVCKIWFFFHCMFFNYWYLVCDFLYFEFLFIFPDVLLHDFIWFSFKLDLIRLLFVRDWFITHLVNPFLGISSFGLLLWGNTCSLFVSNWKKKKIMFVAFKDAEFYLRNLFVFLEKMLLLYELSKPKFTLLICITLLMTSSPFKSAIMIR